MTEDEQNYVRANPAGGFSISSRGAGPRVVKNMNLREVSLTPEGPGIGGEVEYELPPGFVQED